MHATFGPESYRALRQWRYFELDTVEEAQARITNVLHPHKLTPARQPRGARYRMDFVRLNGLGFAAIDHGGEMHLDSFDESDLYLLLFCPSGTGVVECDGAEFKLSGRFGFACNPRQSFRARFSESNEQLVFCVDTGVFARNGDGRLPHLRPRVDLDEPGMQPWLALMHTFLSNAEFVELARTNRLIAASLEELVSALLLQGHPHTLRPLRTAAVAPATVRRSEEFIRENIAKPLNLQAIAAAIGIPQRTLLEAFRRFRDTSPMKYVRDLRLDAVRARLADARSPVTVAEVAVEFGFSHLSRFSQEYRRRFGENPSDTLARARSVRALPFSERKL